MTDSPIGGYDTVTFLSDYGTKDGFVGVVHSIIRQLAPGTHIVDLTHDIEPFDVRAASLVLARSVQFLCPGVILAVVDPGVGTDRRPVAVEVGEGAAVLVGPDNGLLAAAVGMIGGAGRAVVLDNPEYHLETGATTFDGRDVFGPVAAHLCRGVPLDELGTAVDTATLMPGVVPLSTLEEGVLTAEVLWIDRFGNCQLNVDPDDLAEWGDVISLSVGDTRRIATRVRTFGELTTGQLGLVTDADGLVAVVADRASAAFDLQCDEGDEVRLEPATDRDAPAVRVELGARPAADPDLGAP